MNKISLALSAILTLALVVIIAPNIFAMNQGKILRNIAIWLAIFVGLGLIYQNFGPGSPYPLFALPAAMSRPQLQPAQNWNADPAPPPSNPETKSKDSDTNDTQGYTPPRE